MINDAPEVVIAHIDERIEPIASAGVVLLLRFAVLVVELVQLARSAI